MGRSSTDQPFPFRIDQTSRWKPPYPAGEHEARLICGDPAAVAVDKLDRFLKEKNLKYPIETIEALDCLWYQVHGNEMTRYEIMRNDEHFPDMLPDALYDELIQNLFPKE
ncbi:MAG: hypothetical protein Unbinned4120contig1000_55 [Prokaryotic dsDNA virus sp.]|jgi:hypothetical protein|nr:MAG: hypothetical protein Unbinned4120contig1000_55 [Prokaryotic dsDNA virus sp.]|tara:strand:- start:19980 stop:20309 length:330 start_codon:yes stop_codon:yes gene_type:complete